MQPQRLNSGFVLISFRSGVNVILEGPCQFQVSSQSSMMVSHGRATVKIPRHLDGFHLDTPAGRLTDLGTEFGVAVGTGNEGIVILTEVFEGEIEIPAETASRKRLVSGEALAIVRKTNQTRLVSSPGVDFPTESLHFDPVHTRYLKVMGLSHYRKTERPSSNPHEGGGLNEIQVFAP